MAKNLHNSRKIDSGVMEQIHTQPIYTLQSERLLLRPLLLADAPELFLLYSNQQLLRFTDTTPHTGISETEAYIHYIHSKFDHHQAFYWGIFQKSNPSKLIGTTGIYNTDWKHRFGSISYIIANEYWKHGFATEALSILLPFYFNILELKRIEIQTYTENLPSIRIAQKLGFTLEGRLRQNFLIEGSYRDSYMYSKLAED